MINLNVTADNFDELKQKVFIALGLTEPAQAKFEMPVATVVAEVEKPKRTRAKDRRWQGIHQGDIKQEERNH